MRKLLLAVATALLWTWTFSVAHGAVVSGQNFGGLWYNAPADSESGWGINLAHQGDVIFATWFTYDLTGKAWWLSMTANKTAEGVYTGTLIRTDGPALSAVPFSPAAVSTVSVGTGTLAFSDANTGTLSYSVNGAGQTKNLTRPPYPSPEHL